MAFDVGRELPSPQPELDRLKHLWNVIDTDWLRSYFSSQRDFVVAEDARHHQYAGLRRLFSEDIEREVKPNHFIMATGSEEKFHLMSEVAREQGGSVTRVPIDEQLAKEFAHTIAEEFGKLSYASTVARGKVSGVSSLAFKRGETVIAADTVVLASHDKVLEKPSDEDELAGMLKLVRGKKIRVVVGVNALVPLKYGSFAPSLYEAAVIVLKIRDLTDEEISNYVKDNRSRVLAVAGGIDFSLESGQELVDVAFPIKVSPLKNSIYDRFYNDQGIKRETVTIDPRSVGILADYLKGMPKDMIAVLMQQARELQERVEKI